MNKTASHPSGEKIAGDGTWGEGKSPFADTGVPAPSTDKRGPQGPSIQGFVGETGEIPASPVSMPDKRGGGAGAQGAAALGKAEADARGFGAEAGGGPSDPCARSSTKMPEGTQPGISRKESPERPTVHERVCGKGEVHSSLRGRPAKEMVGGAVPYGTFAEQKLGVSASQAQGPAGASARGPEKSLGFGTAHIATGSCAPESPAMTVKMPPRHPALAAMPPRKRPQPSVPAFGARAPFPTAARTDRQTTAPRGLSVSQVHLSGPLSRAGPLVPRRDALGAAPDSAVAPDSPPSTARQAVSPDGAFGGGSAAIPFTPSAQQAAGAGRGGGGGGLPPGQQHATNAIQMEKNKGELHTRESLLPHYEKQAKDAQAKLEPLAKAQQQARGQVLAAEQLRDEAKRQYDKDMKEGKDGEASYAALQSAEQGVKEANENASAVLFGKSAEEHNAAKKDADEKQKKLDEKKGEKADLEREQQTLNAKNRKLEDGMTPTERARAEKEKERLKRDQDRQREIQRRLDEKRERREARNRSRPDYRATQRAKARRASNKAAKSLNKAKKLLGIAQSNNKELSKKARKDALAKAKKHAAKAVQAAKDKIAALKEAGEDTTEAEKELKEAEKLEDEIEKEEEKLEAEDQPQEPPPPDPCSLPCECPDCDDGICICFRWPAGGDDDGGEGGGGDGGDDGGGGGGGAGGAEPPDIKVPEGSSVPEPENGNGDDKKKEKEKEKKPSGNGKGGGGAVGPQGGAPQFPEGAYFQQAGNGNGNGNGDDGDGDKKPPDGEPKKESPPGAPQEGGTTAGEPKDDKKEAEPAKEPEKGTTAENRPSSDTTGDRETKPQPCKKKPIVVVMRQAWPFRSLGGDIWQLIPLVPGGNDTWNRWMADYVSNVEKHLEAAGYEVKSIRVSGSAERDLDSQQMKDHLLKENDYVNEQLNPITGDPCFAGFVWFGHGSKAGTLDVGLLGYSSWDLYQRLSHGLDFVCLIGCHGDRAPLWEGSVVPGGVYVSGGRGGMDVIEAGQQVARFLDSIRPASESNVNRAAPAGPRIPPE